MKIEDIKQAFPDADIKLNEPLSNYTYTKTGGPADAVIFRKIKKKQQLWLNGSGIIK